MRADVLLNYRKNPVAWARDVLGYDPWDRQAEILDSFAKHTYTNVASCHGIGKTSIAAVASLWGLLNYVPSRLITTAPTGRQVETLLWSEIRRRWRDAKYELAKIEPGATSIKLADDWYGLGFSTKDNDPDRFQGHHERYMFVVVDEACGISFQIMDEGVEAIVSAGECRVLKIGNPTDATAAFARDCRSRTENSHTIHISAFDTPNFTHFGITEDDIRTGEWKKKIDGDLPRPYLVTPDWVADKFWKWKPSSPLWISRVRGQFPKKDKYGLIDGAWLDIAYERWREWEKTGVPPGGTGRRLACDVGRYGGDSSTVGELWEGVFRILRSEQYVATTTTAGMVLEERERESLDVLESITVDADGIGGGVVDSLLESLGGRGVCEFHGGARPRFVEEEKPEPGKRKFLNRRSEAFWRVRELLDPDMPGALALDPDDHGLAGELTHIRYKVRSDGVTQVESKDDMKARGLESPDRADTLMMAVDGGDERGGGGFFLA